VGTRLWGTIKRRTSNVPWPAFCRHPAQRPRLRPTEHRNIASAAQSRRRVVSRRVRPRRFTDGPPAASPGCSDEVGERTQGGRTWADHRRLQPTIQAEVALCLLSSVAISYQHATSQPGSRHAGRNAHWLAPWNEAMSESWPISPVARSEPMGGAPLCLALTADRGGLWAPLPFFLSAIPS
jgi:hypothetical protein